VLKLTDGGKVVSPMDRPLFTPQKHYLYASGTHLCWRLSKSEGLVWPEGLGELKKLIHLIGSGTHNVKCQVVFKSQQN
jgi:hypothetical protein